MAEIVVSAVISVLCEKLVSFQWMKLARSERIDTQLKKWMKILSMIQAVIADAENKQITDRAVQLWLNDLHDLAYDIDDLLDDLATEAMRRKLNQESHASTTTSKVFKLFPTFTNFSHRNITYGQQMSSKVDGITTKLNTLVELKNDLGLQVNVEQSNRTERQLDRISLVEKLQTMVPKRAKKTLLRKLLQSDESVSILSIIGMGGIGKTALVKVVYNEEELKDHFELRAWVSVSGEFDVFNISKSILEAVSGEDKIFSNIDLLHVALIEILSKKRFLLVLDDVWNTNTSKWELLRRPLLVGAPGSKVIVTAQSKRVASVMGSNETYLLDVLSNEDSLSLFAQHALGEKNFEKHPTLQLHGEAIVRKCGGLPLALEMLGRVLTTSRDADEWEKLLNREIWDTEDRSGIIAAIRLSYYDLPSHLKILFAYCSLFPKDYVFHRNELVLLWMAEGFLYQNYNKSMERLGHDYFEELQSRLFFQHSTDGESGHIMHNLMSDIATSVAGEFFKLDDQIDVSNRDETFEKFRHASVIGP